MPTEKFGMMAAAIPALRKRARSASCFRLSLWCAGYPGGTRRRSRHGLCSYTPLMGEHPPALPSGLLANGLAGLQRVPSRSALITANSSHPSQFPSQSPSLPGGWSIAAEPSWQSRLRSPL